MSGRGEREGEGCRLCVIGASVERGRMDLTVGIKQMVPARLGRYRRYKPRGGGRSLWWITPAILGEAGTIREGPIQPNSGALDASVTRVGWWPVWTDDGVDERIGVLGKMRS